MRRSPTRGCSRRDSPTIPPCVYDTACFSAVDLVELFARVPAERIVFASDMPYGRPVVGLFHAYALRRRASATPTAALGPPRLVDVLLLRTPSSTPGAGDDLAPG